MPPPSLPIFVIGLAVGGYWLQVMRMARRAKRRSGRAAGLIPREATGRANRVLWAPAVAIWVAHPFYAAVASDPPWLLAPLADVPAVTRWGLTAIVILCVALTTVCWRRMGKSWRMGIDPNERTSLVVTGPYAFVRHPIYALSLFMMLATMTALPSPLMLAAGAVHVALLVWEARREERHLASLHGDTYRLYCARVGRFVPVPRAAGPMPARGSEREDGR